MRSAPMSVWNMLKIKTHNIHTCSRIKGKICTDLLARPFFFSLTKNTHSRSSEDLAHYTVNTSWKLGLQAGRVVALGRRGRQSLQDYSCILQPRKQIRRASFVKCLKPVCMENPLVVDVWNCLHQRAQDELCVVMEEVDLHCTICEVEGDRRPRAKPRPQAR